MSDAVTGLGYPAGMLGVVVGNSQKVKGQLDQLTQQVSTGLVSSSFGGLGGGAAGVALSVGPAVAHNQVWQNNIDAVSGTQQVAQTALSQISSIASSFYAQINNLNGLNPSNIDTVAASARDALSEVANLLDSKNGNTYVFAGQDSASPPVPNPDSIGSSGFATQIAVAVQALTSNGAAATIATIRGIAGSNAAGTSPFSAAVSQTAASANALRVTVQTGDSQFQATGIVAGTNASAPSLGTSTSGSYIRDIMASLATLGALSSGQQGTTGFAQLVSDAQTCLGGAITALNTDAGIMGNQQTALAATKTSLADTQTALSAQLSSAQDVDMAATLTKLTQTQTRMQASYQLIASLQGLSLTKYLTA